MNGFTMDWDHTPPGTAEAPDTTQEEEFRKRMILKNLRRYLECIHRSIIFHDSGLPREKKPLQPQTIEQAFNCCNKEAALYVTHANTKEHMMLLLYKLNSWSYKQWFRPYQSDVEYRQFTTKVFLPGALPCGTPPLQIANAVVENTASICNSVETIQQHVRENDPDQLSRLYSKEVVDQPNTKQLIQDQEFYILQPLFRAISLLVDGSAFVPGYDISGLPVLIVLTGVEDGLSGPIEFPPNFPVMGEDKINAAATSLVEAFNFLFYLEERERLFFGVRPDPVESTRNLRIPSLLQSAENLGWEGPLPAGPTSRWVTQS
ncbi:hypothetical protein B0T10DRAFT_587183 [Thelonectria olida]|uniref:Uncharacterized protein n=1 Tax=Thelonectria olida TaxID=1576542 RepID=A0A9P8WBT5_9HYPO|nr:hypothetical protein B0T10DRAFT_587183 [Thelonectria olida]